MNNPPALSDDPAFLQDQVLRLTAELARQQGRPAPPPEAAPWLLNAEQLPPLLGSYDARLTELERSEAAQRERADAAEKFLQAAQTSEDRMRVELSQALEKSVRQEALASAGLGGAKAASSAATGALQERLDVLYQENEVLVEQQRETNDELDRLREEKLAQAREHMALVKQLASFRDELAAADHRARRAADQRDRARSELQQCASELVQAQEHTQQAMAIAERHAAERDAALASVSEHRAMLGQLNGRASADRETLHAELAVARNSEQDVREKAAILEQQCAASAEREKKLMDRLSGELADKAAGAEALSALEARCADAEGRVEVTAQELTQARAAINEASAERTLLLSRAQAAESAAARADERLAAIGQEERGRREALTASLRKETISRTAALEEEVRSMETTIADLNHQLGKATRERARTGRHDGLSALSLPGGGLGGADAASAALFASSLAAQQMAGMGGGGGGSLRAMDEMASRLASAERERDSTEQQRRSLAMQLRSSTEAQTSERAAATARAEQTQRQMRHLEEQVGELRQERARLLGNVAELEQAASTARSELNALRHSSSEELRIATESAHAKEATLQRQLADARTLHDQSASEVEELLQAQEELSGRYRTEAKTIAERSESLVNELRAESERLTIRNAELSSQLAAATATNNGLDRAERDKGAQVVLLQRQLKEAQLLRTQQGTLIAQLRASEQSWQAERKVLLRQARADLAVAAAVGGAAAELEAEQEVRRLKHAATRLDLA